MEVRASRTGQSATVSVCRVSGIPIVVSWTLVADCIAQWLLAFQMLAYLSVPQSDSVNNIALLDIVLRATAIQSSLFLGGRPLSHY